MCMENIPIFIMFLNIATMKYIIQILFFVSLSFGAKAQEMHNAYAVMDQEAFDAWVKTLSPEVKRAYEARNAYWRSLYSPLIGEVQDWLYDQFLKGNNISSGTGNYGEVIALLLSLEGK